MGASSQEPYQAVPKSFLTGTGAGYSGFMRIDNELATFLSSPVMTILGTCDTHGSPEIGRGVGSRVDSETGLLEVVLSSWQWPGTVANVRSHGRAAVTFARPHD